MTGKNQYELTKSGVSNYFTDSRNTSGATLNNVTVLPKQACSYDSTYNLAKCTATGSSPSVSRTSLATLNNGRISGSIWLKADTTLSPGTITLTMTDGSDSQSVSTTITNDGTLKRYAISGYFTTASTTCKLKVSWTSTTGVVYLDQWQIENNDWASEAIVNTSTTASQERTIYTDPNRLSAIAVYKHSSVLNWTDVPIYDGQKLPHNYSTRNYNTSTMWYNTAGYGLNIENAQDGTHLVYHGYKKPIYYTSDSDVFDVPAPEVWQVVEGVVAYLKSAKYDIGSSKEAAIHWSRFEAAVRDMVNTSRANPAWGYTQVLYPTMMA